MKKRIVFLLIAVFLLLAACGKEGAESTGTNEILIYRVIREEYHTGSELIRAEKLRYSDGSNVIRGAAAALKSIPDDAALACALPASVNIQRVEQSGRTVDVYMNSAYSDLAGMDKTIADSCISLTMCSVEGVDYVTIHTANGSSSTRLTSEDILLRNTLTSAAQAEIRLYFPKADDNVLAAEYRPVTISGDISSERIVIDELLKGPTSAGLSRALPEGTVVLSVYTKDGICTVSFSDGFLHGLENNPDSARLAIYSVVNSLTSLTEIDSVVIIVQNSENTLIGGIDISVPLTRKPSMIGSAVIE